MIYLYFVFATPIVQEFESLNAEFQQTKADPHALYQKMFLHHQSLQNRLHDSNGHKKDVNNVDYGAKFIAECNRYLQENCHSEKAVKIVQDVKSRCMSVLEEALTQLSSRLPPAKNTFQRLAYLSPVVALSQTTRAPFASMPFQNLLGDKFNAIEEQYRKLICVDWAKEPVFKATGIPDDAEEFWMGVLRHDVFADLANYALTCLITPISNATVERVFSLVTAVKTKPRNRMQVMMLDAIVRIRTEMILMGKCCVGFKIKPLMLQNLDSETVYATGSTNDDEDDEMFL